MTLEQLWTPERFYKPFINFSLSEFYLLASYEHRRLSYSFNPGLYLNRRHTETVARAFERNVSDGLWIEDRRFMFEGRQLRTFRITREGITRARILRKRLVRKVRGSVHGERDIMFLLARLASLLSPSLCEGGVMSPNYHSGSPRQLPRRMSKSYRIEAPQVTALRTEVD